MKKACKLMLAVLLALSFTACQIAPAAGPGEDAFRIRVICESGGIQQLFYSCYLDDAYYAQGGMADLAGDELTADTELTLTFPRSYFEGAEDISRFAIDFSPYGKDDTSEIMTTEKVRFAPEYGKTYTIHFSGDKETGFQARLQS